MPGPFKEDYDNYRDDHVIFRSLTTSGGTISADENQVEFQLVLEPDYLPSIRRHLERYLKKWNAEEPEPSRWLRPIPHAQPDHRSGNLTCASGSQEFRKSLSSGQRLRDRNLADGLKKTSSNMEGNTLI